MAVKFKMMEKISVIRSRRRTLALVVDRSGAVVVRAPLRAPAAWIRDFVEAHRGWIEKQERCRRRRLASRPAFVDGALLPYRGERFPLRFSENESGPRFDGEALRLPPMPPDRVRLVLTGWFKARALEQLSARAAVLAAAAGINYRRLSVRDARSRWGSCGPDGGLSFNWKLILASLAALDYVVAHELAHLTVKNHSKRFWRRVAAILPEFETGRRWLRAHGQALLDF